MLLYMKNIILLIVILFFLFIILFIMSKKRKIQKYKLFIYWECKPNHKKPEFINLCNDTVKKHCSGDFDVIFLNEKNVYFYLPDLRKDINDLPICQKTDYIRVALLYKYGGVWLDADTIVMKKMTPLIDKLNNGYDYIGFGCSTHICSNGKPRPSNWAMGSQKNGILMKECLDNLNSKLNEHFKNNPDIEETKKKFSYFELGKDIMWNNINKLMSNGWDYYHFDASVEGSRDINGEWVNVDNHLSEEPTIFLDKNKLFLVFLENSKFSGDDEKYNWFSKISRREILNGNWFISQLLRESLDIEKK